MLHYVVQVRDPGLEWGGGYLTRLVFEDAQEATEAHDRAVLSGFEAKMWPVLKVIR